MLEPVLEVSKQIASSHILASATTEVGAAVNDLVNGTTPVSSSSGINVVTMFVSQVVRVAVPAAVIALVLLMSYGAITMATSQGNPEKINEAKEIVTNALIGFVVVVGAGAILFAANGLLGLGLTP
jgi:hypothetical protein